MKIVMHTTMRNNLVLMNHYLNSRDILLSRSKRP